jgi:hypothetical protein
VTGDAVAAAANGELQSPLSRDVRCVRYPDDKLWAAVDSAIEDGARLVVALVLGAYQPAPHLGRELSDARLIERLVHVQPEGVSPIVSHDPGSDRWSLSLRTLQPARWRNIP